MPPRWRVKMFYPSSNTARTHAHTSISTLKSLVNFCSRDFLFNQKFDDSTLVKRHTVVGHFVRSDTSHVMQAIDVTRHSRITQQLVSSTTLLSFVCCSQFTWKKLLLMTFGTTLVYYKICLSYVVWMCCSVVGRVVPDDVKDCNTVIFRVSLHPFPC